MDREAHASGETAASSGHRGLLAVALPWLAGTLALHQLPQLPSPAWYVPLALIALLAVRSSRSRWLTFLIAGFVWTAVSAEWRMADRLPAELVGADLRVSGWVDAFPSPASDRVRFSLRVTNADEGRVPRRLRLTWYHPPLTITAGSELELVVRLRRPRGLANPGGFDYERWLFVEGYGATGYVRSGGLAAHDVGGGLGRRWFGVRAQLAERIDTAAPNADAAALLTALTLGERFGFTEQHWASLRRTGTSHLVAISGMHVGLVAALVFLLVQRLWRTLPVPAALFDLEAAALAAAFAAAGYAALAGFAVPTQRALVMVAVGLAVLVGRRFVGLFDGLAAALLLVLMWDPLAPLGASFWMSFVAVTVLLLMASQRTVEAVPGTVRQRALRSLRTVVRLQWGVTLALIPLVALYFGELSLVSPLVNLLAIPFFSFVLVPLTLLASLALSVSETLLHAAGWLAIGTWGVLDGIAAWTWAAVRLSEPPPVAFALAFLAVLAAVPANPLPARWLACLALLPLALAHPPQRPETGALRATVLDVGHGLAVLVETRQRRLLYDAGPSYGSGFDSGTDVVLPAVAMLAANRLDAVMISHDHNDHTGGVDAVLDAYPEVLVLKGPDIERFGGGYCAAGQSWSWDGVVFSVLHPARGFEHRGNESSCVLKVATQAGALLITGDIEARAERALRQEAAVAAAVVVVPHHGSATSSSAAFIEATGAELALISTDYYSRWRFPRPEVRRRWQQAGAQVLVTGERGAITVEMGARGIEVHTERDRRTRYWTAASTPSFEAT